jgi:hypothetical protein
MPDLKVIKLIQEIDEQLLYVNQAVFLETKKAPRLTVLIDKDIFTQMVQALHIDSGYGFIPNSTEILQDQTIHGYPVEAVLFMDEPDTVYKISQTHITGAKHEFYEEP